MQLQNFSLSLHHTLIQGWYTSPEPVKGVVVLVHGLGEHSGRYLRNVVPMMIKMDMAVVIYDNFGHGKSGGKQGHCPSYAALMELLDLMVKKACSLYPSSPLFLYGHSMGGNLVLNYVLRHTSEIKGVVATSPYLRLAFEPPKWKMMIGKAMMHIFPSITLPSGLDASGISRIPEEVDKYEADPLVHDKVSPMFSFPIMEAGEWAIENAGKLTIETLLLHGSGDPIIDYTATQEFHRHSDKTAFKLFEGGYHELHHDVCGEEMLQEIAAWLRMRI